MERKAVLRCVVCDSATADEETIKKFYSHKSINMRCPVCCSRGNTLRIDLVTHDEYMKIKKGEEEKK